MRYEASDKKGNIVKGFGTPPDSARPRVWWHWMDGNVTKEGVRKDLEWMKRVGIGGLQNFDGSLETPQLVEKRIVYMTPEWQDVFRYATRIAGDLHLEFGIASSPGWSETGGPWVQPQDGMKKLVWSTVEVSGEGRFRGRLPSPPVVAGPFQDVVSDSCAKYSVGGLRFYRDVRVLAFRSPSSADECREPRAIRASDTDVAISPLAGGASGVPTTLRASSDGRAWIVYDYGKPESFRGATLTVPFESLRVFSWELEASQDGAAFRRIAEFPRGYQICQTTISFPRVAARYFRLSMTRAPLPEIELGANAPGAVDCAHSGTRDRVTLNGFRLNTGAQIHCFELKAGFAIASRYYPLNVSTGNADDSVDPGEVLDITDRMVADGELEWDLPGGRWTILRLGYSLTGKTNHPASCEATGLEVDKLDRRAVKAYLDAYLGNFERALEFRQLGEAGVRAFVTDSIESAGQNWTPALIEEFESRRGYDPIPWLPAVTGVIVGNAVRSDAFLWDFRKTLMELLSESHYGQIAASVGERGLLYYAESLEGYPFAALGDDLDMRQHADIPMAAIWTNYKHMERDGVLWHIADMRGAASVAHAFGKNRVAAESLTSGYEPWAYSPATLRPIIDLAFALGVNLSVIHASVHQPTDKKPGMTLGNFGQHFSRHEIWADLAGPWITYLARSCYLLQLGCFVADVAWFYGEEGSLAGAYADGEPADLPDGYGFDFVNANILLNHLRTDEGRLVSSGGAIYRLLYLGGSSERMTLAVLRKLKELSDQGVPIAGRRPVASPSLADEAKQEEYRRIVKELWDSGRIMIAGHPNAVLGRLGLARDFDYERLEPDSRLMHLHRRLSDGDVYFLSNRKARDLCTEARFRVTGRRPELWYAHTGKRKEVSWRQEGSHTVVPLKLSAHESVFVMFLDPSGKRGEEVAEPNDSLLLRIEGDWQLTLEPGGGAPEEAISTQLGSWTDSVLPSIKYFSGIGTYRKTFLAKPPNLKGNERLILDLGQVHELAEVCLNGATIGVVWCAPFELDVTEAFRDGSNSLVVRVANLWVNRLIGDQQPGAVPVAFTTAKTYKADAPLRPSGLVGPVLLKRRAA